MQEESLLKVCSCRNAPEEFLAIFRMWLWEDKLTSFHPSKHLNSRILAEIFDVLLSLFGEKTNSRLSYLRSDAGTVYHRAIAPAPDLRPR